MRWVLDTFFFSYPFYIGSTWGMILSAIAGILDGLSSGIFKKFGAYNRFILLFVRFGAGALLALSLAIILREHVPAAIAPESIISLIIIGTSLFAIDALWLYGFSHFDLNLGGDCYLR